MSTYIEQGFVQVIGDSDPLKPETEMIFDPGVFTIDRIHVLGDSVFIHATKEQGVEEEEHVIVVQNGDNGQPRLFASPDCYMDSEAFDLPS